MNLARTKMYLSSILCMVLIAATALITTGCSERQPEPSSDSSLYPVSETPHVLGSGEHTFLFSVLDETGQEVQFELSSSETTVGAALLEQGLIEGEAGPYGLLVTTVNGLRRDYDADKMYWAFYIDGEYAMTGVDETQITDGTQYSFQVEQA